MPSFAKSFVSAREPHHPSPSAVLVTDQDERVAHYLTDDQVCAPTRDENPRAMCGHTFQPAGLTMPIGRVCAACLDLVDPPTRPRGRRNRPRRAR
jgi:hypothetical protein